MIENPQIRRISAQPAAVIHIVVPRADMPRVFGPALKELLDTLAAQRITPAGAPFAHHRKMSAESFDFELGVLINAPVAPTGRVTPGELPAALVAQAIYVGPYEGLHSGWMEFEDWIASNGHVSSGSLWETYLTDPAANPDPATWRTELTRPLTR